MTKSTPNENGKKNGPEGQQEEYAVGYGRPPKDTRFKPGSSGNPRGRPKGARGLKTDLKAELSKKVTVNDGGKKRTMTKQQVFINQLTTQAAKGDLRAISKIIDLIRDAVGLDDENIKNNAQLSIPDQKLLKGFVSEVLRGEGGTDDQQ
jgi:hypothetical protein